MLCKALSIPRNSRMSRSVFCDASHVLRWISSTKDESSSSGILSIGKSVGSSALSLFAALSDLSSEGYLPNFFFLAFIPPNLSLKVFGAKS